MGNGMLIKSKMQYKINEFKSDRCGGFAVVFALSAIPLILVAGIAVDYSRATSARTSLQKAGENRKFIVLRTDGENMISANARSTTSDYTAYGFLLQNRLGTGGNEISAAFQNAAVERDNRMTPACNGAKVRGITVVTILFRETSQRAINNVRGCASRPDLFFRAADQTALEAAFQNIASQISNLRLVR